MHDDHELVEKRITRELSERVLPLVHTDRRPFTIQSGPSLDELQPFAVGSVWGAPWATTWFRFDGEIPDSWSSHRVEAVIDLGFDPNRAGFQCEGLIVDGSGRPVQGIHPRRTNYRVEALPGPVTITLEAASNPSFALYTPSLLGSIDTAGDEPLYDLRRAELVVVDSEAEALSHDLDVLNGVMLTLPLGDPRRGRLLRTIERSLNVMPDVESARRVLRSALEMSARSSAHRIIATGHAHIDTAWLWPMSETVRKCTRTFASAVGLMDEYPEFRFACSQAQQYAWIEERHPELFERMRAKIRAGQWLPVGGMWVEADMNMPSGESIVRQIVFGQRYFESRFGQRCREVWIPDVFGYPAGMPQVFAAGGMDRFVTQKLSWNQTNRFPHHTFWWEGLDGTRVLTHFPPVDLYNAQITPEECHRASEQFSDDGWSDWSLMPFGHGDGGGGPTREMLERARRLEDLDGAPRVSIGSPSEFFEHVEGEALAGARVPVWRGELYLEMHRGTLTSQLRTKLGNRRCERLLREVELWSATAGRRADVDDIWREVLTQQFHDILPGSSIAWVHADAEVVFERAQRELCDRIASLIDDLAPREPTAINVAGVERDEVVVVASQVDCNGESQRLADGSSAVRLAVPGSGMSAVKPLPADDRVVVTGTSLSNEHVAVRFDTHGNIVSFIDRVRDREVVPAGRVAARLTLGSDQPVRYDAWDLESWTLENAAAVGGDVSCEVVESGPLLGRLSMSREFGPSRATITYTLRAGSPRLDIDIELDWHHSEHLLSMEFPIDVRADSAACDVQFGHVHRPMHPSSSWDAAKFEVCAHRYVDVSEPSFGVAVLNNGRYGHGLFDGGVRVSLARAARFPDPAADQGVHSVTLALFPHGPELADVVAEAERLNYPIRVVSGSADVAAPPVIELVGDGVELDAIKVADDDPRDLIIRIHEACGDRTAVTVRCPTALVAGSRCNLLEEPLAELEVVDGMASLTLRPFEIVTLRLTSNQESPT
ncbi:MAG: glycoside hydrolase family 38 C-terminal domain-containing protein [Acidimicrobiia bacterium]|nr:MAG: glycoside hydrolase family 38 C-terminal domain-containing protein [Acidimicrobiia bacterium]